MKILKGDIREDLELLIQLSCESAEKEALFEQFHKLLIEIYYAATDVFIDYELKRVYMNIEAEDSKGDFLRQIDNFIPTRVGMNHSFENLNKFLVDSIKDKNSMLEEHYPLLKEQFFRGQSHFRKNRFLEEA